LAGSSGNGGRRRDGREETSSATQPCNALAPTRQPHLPMGERIRRQGVYPSPPVRCRNEEWTRS
jgi:hypothetical protein